MAEGPRIARGAETSPDAPRVLVVYGLKTDDYGWLAGFYPARRLAETCENRGIPLRFLFPGDVPAYLAGDGASAGRAIALVRGHVGKATYALLEGAGYRCVNDFRAASLARDKLETYRFLSARGWPTPETRTVDDALATRATLGLPCVVKPRFGSRGEGVSLAHDAEELAARVCGGALAGDGSHADNGSHAGDGSHADNGSHAGDGSHADNGSRAGDSRAEYVAQEYVASSRGRDVRVFFAGGDVIAVARRTNAGGDVRSNACAGGVTEPIADGSFARYEAMTLDIAREAGLWYGTVDWLYRADGSMTVCEINSSPGFEALEKSCSIDVAGAIIDRLVKA